MAFVQIIDFHTTDFAGLLSLEQEWEQATEGTRTARRSLVLRDRVDPHHYQSVVFFDSYESAMENSTLPATQAFAEKFATLVDGTAVFHDLDVVDDRS